MRPRMLTTANDEHITAVAFSAAAKSENATQSKRFVPLFPLNLLFPHDLKLGMCCFLAFDLFMRRGQRTCRVEAFQDAPR